MEPTDMNDNELMSAIERHPATYTDTHICKSAEVKKRADAWKAVVQELGNRYSCKDIQSRYHNIRSAFGRYLKRNKSVTDKASVKESWAHAAFLYDPIKHNINKENRNLATEAERDTEGDRDTPRTTVPAKKRVIEDVDSVIVREDGEASSDPSPFIRKRRPERSSLESSSSHTQKTPEVKDEAELFCLSLIPKVRRLNPYNLAMTQIKMIELLTTAEFGSFNVPTQPAPYPYHTPQPAAQAPPYPTPQPPNPSTPMANLLSSLTN